MSNGDPQQQLATRGTTPWLWFGGGEVPAADVARRIERAQQSLRRHGLRPGEAVAVVMHRHPDSLAALLAIWELDAAALLLAPDAPAALSRTLQTHATSRLTIDRDLTVVAARDTAAATPAGCVTAAATLIPTSGSSGAPKLVAHQLAQHGASAAGAAAFFGLTPRHRWLVPLPLHHVGGLAPLFRTLRAGASLALVEPGASLAGTLIAARPTHVSLVPTQLVRLLNDRDGSAALAAAEAVLVGGGPLAPAVRERALGAGVRLIMSYGSTEAASMITAEDDPAAMLNHGCAGRALPGREVDVAADGEILVRGASMLVGYVESPGRLREGCNADGWFATRDVGRLDPDGRLFVLGRKDAMFVSGGENIHPEEIEAALLTHPDLTEAVVVSIPDAEFGASPVAFVRGGDREAPTPEALRRHLADQLPRFKVPKRFLWLDAEEALKPDRQALQQRAAATSG
ncbi:MAG: AMP-binding protein [Planctomycetota bacterium]